MDNPSTEKREIEINLISLESISKVRDTQTDASKSEKVLTPAIARFADPTNWISGANRMPLTALYAIKSENALKLLIEFLEDIPYLNSR